MHNRLNVFIMVARLIMSLISSKSRVSYYFMFRKIDKILLNKVLRIVFSTSYSYTLTFSLQAECFFYPSCAACFYFYRSHYIKFLLEAQLLPFHWEIVILKILWDSDPIYCCYGAWKEPKTCKLVKENDIWYSLQIILSSEANII